MKKKIKLFEEFNDETLLTVGDIVSLDLDKMMYYFDNMSSEDIIHRYNSDNLVEFFKYDTFYTISKLDRKQYGSSVGYLATIEKDGYSDDIDSKFLTLKSSSN